jgi:hypothetical protein
VICLTTCIIMATIQTIHCGQCGADRARLRIDAFFCTRCGTAVSLNRSAITALNTKENYNIETWMGFGTTYRGFAAWDPYSQTYVATAWHVFYVPFWPVASFRLARGSSTVAGVPQVASKTTTRYTLFHKVHRGSNLGQIFKTLIFGNWLLYVVLLFVLSDKTRFIKPTLVNTLFGLAFLFIAAVIARAIFYPRLVVKLAKRRYERYARLPRYRESVIKPFFVTVPLRDRLEYSRKYALIALLTGLLAIIFLTWLGFFIFTHDYGRFGR